MGDAEHAFAALVAVFDAKQVVMEELALMNRCGDQLATKYPAEPARAVAAYDLVIAARGNSLKTGDPIDHKALSNRIINNLIHAMNIKTNDQLAACKLGRLDSLKNFGPTSFRMVCKYLEDRGYHVNCHRARPNDSRVLAQPKAEVSPNNNSQKAIAYAKEARQRAIDTAQIISIAKGLGLMVDITQLPALLAQLKEIAVAKAALPSQVIA